MKYILLDFISIFKSIVSTQMCGYSFFFKIFVAKELKDSEGKYEWKKKQQKIKKKSKKRHKQKPEKIFLSAE